MQILQYTLKGNCVKDLFEMQTYRQVRNWKTNMSKCVETPPFWD